MRSRIFFLKYSMNIIAVVLVCCALSACTVTLNKQSPNIVLIYADDLGYGDVSCYGATEVQTPNIDRLAQQGLRFTNAYSAAATCTPSRYALLTGEYAFRREGTGIAPGDAPLIIDPSRRTLPDVFSEAGYKTGIVGKWHLGLGSGNLDWNGEIKPGPLELGFDYCFIIPATGDRVPCVFVENHHVAGLETNDPIRVRYGKKIGEDPTGMENPELLKVRADRQHSETIVNGISRIGYMAGGNAARWVDEKLADVLTEKAVSFIDKHKERPFFLYFSLHDIHVPRMPNSRFVGRTNMGARGDVIVQLDWCVGEIIRTLESRGLSDNTMIIFTSDNGPVLNDGYMDKAEERVGNHKMAGPLRGGKYSSFEGGTRVPFIVWWRDHIKPGVSDALISQIDLFASFAKITGQTLSDQDAGDSIDLLPALLGKSTDGRKYIVEQAMGGYLSIRDREWKFIAPGPGPELMKDKNIETGRSPVPQLYHVKYDIGEKENQAEIQPEKLGEMSERLKRIQQTPDRLINSQSY